MTELIRVENAALAGVPEAISFTLSGGDMMVLVTPKDEVTTSLTKIIIGLEKPPSGKVSLFSGDVASFTVRELQEARRRIGIAYGTGGLISNLKVWENLTLPLYYHQHLGHDEIEARGLALLGRLGYSGKLMDLPGHLGLSQKKLVGCARAMIIDPDVIIYESPLSGLSQEETNSFFRIAKEFHHEKPERASLFITSNLEIVRSLPEAVVVNFVKGRNS